jgi:hypothetical protein
MQRLREIDVSLTRNPVRGFLSRLVSSLCLAQEQIAGHDSTEDVSVPQSNMHRHNLDAVCDGALLVDCAGRRCCHLFV